MTETLVKRYKRNPVLTKNQVPYEVATVHNAAVVKTEDKYMMVFRSHLLNGRSILGLAESDNGYDFKVHDKPFMTSQDKDAGIYESISVEDPRITYINGEYLITYSAYSEYGIRIGLAKTKDFTRVERVAMISEVDYRNTVIFPEKFNGMYARLDRPHSELNPWSMWISYSPDLIHWGGAKHLVSPLKYHWDEMKIGPGAPPIKTVRGWLNIYHGVFPTMAGSVYRLGVCLHDLKDPSKIIGVSDKWILEPEENYERVGYVPNVVFTCAAVPEEDGTVKIYWGGADTVMCAGTARIDDLVNMCLGG
ncbi:MAG: glycosidase [Chlorobi bacterium]|nr:glycosidase [Chlorobiota bacterium]